MIGIVIITHGHFGEELLRTAEDIAGRQEAVTALAVTSETGPEHLSRQLDETYLRLRGPEGVLFLVDMMGGTPCNSAMLKFRDQRVEVVTGVNLYMLLSAFTHRTQLDLRALAVKACEDGKRAIVLPRDLLAKKERLMPVVLLRVDDRLVHGQVVEGWLKATHVTRLAVVSDAVVADEMQKALYMLAIPQGVGFSCLSVADASAAWTGPAWERERVLVLVSSVDDVVSLVEKGVKIESVNIGGLHFREGRIQVLKAVSLDDRDVAALRALAARGILLEARPLPLDEPVDVMTLLETSKAPGTAPDGKDTHG